MKVKGAVLLSRAAFVKKSFGDKAWMEVLSALPSDDGTDYAGLLASSWYPFEVGQRLDDAIVRVLGKGDRKVFEDLGAASARENLTTVHRTFVAGRDPQGFMEKAPVIYGFYYDTGRRTWERTGPSSGVMTTYDAGSYSAVDCLTVIGWYREALGMCGAGDVVVQETACRARGDAVCRYEFRWRSGPGG